MVKRGEGYFQNSGGSWLKGELKIQGGGVWTLDEAMSLFHLRYNIISIKNIFQETEQEKKLKTLIRLNKI